MYHAYRAGIDSTKSSSFKSKGLFTFGNKSEPGRRTGTGIFLYGVLSNYK